MHIEKGRPATPPASAAVRRWHPAPARNPPAQTSDAPVHLAPGTLPESMHSTAPGIPDSPPAAGSAPLHRAPSAPAKPWEKNKESPPAGTAHASQQHHQSAAKMSGIFRE